MNSQKQNRHSLMAKGIMVLLSLLVLIFIITFAWFKDPRDPVTASGLTLSTKNTTTDFEYAVGFSTSQTGGRYTHTEFTNDVNNDLNLEELYAYDDTNHDQKINLLYDYTPIDVTGNGVNLIRPSMNYGNWSINAASQNYSVAEENVQYISFDLIFRTEVPDTIVKLDADSVARGVCETSSGDGSLVGAPAGTSGVSVGDKNSQGYVHSFNYNALTSSDPESNKYGRFSRDAIVGAVRVAFLNFADSSHSLTVNEIVNNEQTTFNSEPALLWIPRPDLFLDNGATANTEQELLKDGQTEGWELDTGVTNTKLLVSKAQRNTSYSTYEHQYYNIFENQSAAVLQTYEAAIPSVYNASAGGDKVYFGQQKELLPLTYYNSVDHKYYGKIRVRIWIEGTDSESRRALAGGMFRVAFHITA